MATEVIGNKVDLIVKEIELTKLLASNNPKIRNDGIKHIKQLLSNHSGDTIDAFCLNDYMLIWRGLFYFMWMSDKPLPQESATEKISNLFHCCTSYQGKILFLDAFFLTIKDDWISISQHRIDKFMMLVRRCLRQVLFTFVNCNWDLEYIEKFSEVLYKALKSFTLSLRTHLQEIFLEELAKVSKGKVPSEALISILDAFLHYISELNDFMPIKEVIQNVFRNLLSQSPDLEILEAKFEAWRKMGKPGKSYNDLELVEGDIADNDTNDGPLDPRAGNVSVEIPRIKFNAKDVAKLLNKYVTEVDCTRKCLIEITKLIKWYNRLGEGMLPYKPKDLKLNSQVLKRKKNKNLSKMIKDGVKKLEMIDSKLKKSSREVSEDYKSLKELDKMGEIIVEHGKIGKSIWKVRKVDESSALKENFSLNESWTVSDEVKNDNTNQNACIIDNEPPLLVPIGFNVEVSETSDQTPMELQQNISIPSLKSLINTSSPKESNTNKHKSPKSMIVESVLLKKNISKSNSPSISNSSMKSPNALNISHNSSVDNDSVTKKLKQIEESVKTVKRTSSSITPNFVTNSAKKSNITNITDVEDTIMIESPNNGTEEKKTQIQSKVNQQSPYGDLVMSKIQRDSYVNNISSSINESWSVCDDEKLNMCKNKSPNQKAELTIVNKNNEKSPRIKNVSPIISDKSHNFVNTSSRNSWSVSDDIDESTPKKVEENEEKEKEKSSSLSTTITPDKNSKSPKSPTPEQRVLRRRTIIIPRKKPEGQPKESTPKRKVKDMSEIKLKNRRKTIAGEEISMLKPEEISNKALEKVRSEAFDDGFGSPRKSSRLSIKMDSARKRVEFQLKNNVEQEFMEYETTLVTKPENPHDASKQPVQGVLKLTPDTNRINPFYKFHGCSVKKNTRKSII